MNKIISRLYRKANKQGELDFYSGSSNFNEEIISEKEFLNNTEFKNFRKSLHMLPLLIEDGGQSVIEGIDSVTQNAKQLITYLNDIIDRNEAYLHSWSDGKINEYRNY